MNIEIRYMDSGPGGHSHQPTQAELNAVIQMFACHNINLNIVVTGSLPEYNVMPRDPANPNIFFNYNNGSSSFAYLKATYFQHATDPGWHHCIFGHEYANTAGGASGSSGLGETPGDDFVVTMGSFTGQIGTPWDRAATLAHEFGHNLGLPHSQRDTIGDFPPTRPTIMSYFYQLSGVRTQLIASGLSTAAAASLFKDLDYSNGTMCSQNEAALNEVLGTRLKAVDWNCNGMLTNPVNVIIDIAQSWCPNPSGSAITIMDVNEWASIHDPTATNRPEELTNMPVSVCITRREADKLAADFPSGQPTPAVEPCVSGRMAYIEPINLANPTGTCSIPYNGVKQAQAAVPAGSNLFLYPANYHEGGGSVTLNKPMSIFSNVGASIIQP